MKFGGAKVDNSVVAVINLCNLKDLFILEF